MGAAGYLPVAVREKGNEHGESGIFIRAARGKHECAMLENA